MKILLSFLLISVCLSANAKNPVVVMKTNKGEIHVELDAVKAPASTANFLKYAADKKYDGTIFHRVIDNFMIQGGGFTSEMKKVDVYSPIKNEAHNGLKNLNGTIAMARTQDPNSATNQFFINVQNNHFLDHRSKKDNEYGYAVFGKVIKGMSVVNQIKKVAKGNKGSYGDVPVDTILINTVRKQ